MHGQLCCAFCSYDFIRRKKIGEIGIQEITVNVNGRKLLIPAVVCIGVLCIVVIIEHVHSFVRHQVQRKRDQHQCRDEVCELLFHPVLQI